jgi:two-component system chemotaxis sensor kinase CheA
MAAPHQNEFLAEARDHLTDVCDQLLRLERAKGDAARERIEQMLRAVHSIKGGAGFFGLRTIEQLAHRMESVFEGALEPAATRDPRLVDVLLAATDRLAALLDDLDRSNEADTSDLLARLDELLAPRPAENPSGSSDQAGDADPGSAEPKSAVSAAPDSTSKAAATLTDESAIGVRGHQFEIALDLGAYQASGLSPSELVERVAQIGEVISGTIDTPDVDLEVSPPGHPVIWRATIQSTLDAAAFNAQLIALAPLVGNSQSTVGEAATADTAIPDAAITEAAAAARPASSSIRISVELVDQLMNLAGELVLVRNQSRRYTAADQPLPGQVIGRLDAVTSEFQETVLQTRMQPVGNLFNKFPRMVRDLSRQLGKQIELRIEGAEIELDKTILDALTDPLTHLVRNACDHGLESTEERERAGKPPQGVLQLTASHLGDQIWITIEDNGRGIDRERIHRKALEQRLRTPEELARLDDRDLLALILLPGFSTAAQVTDVSGRGVGMDVVKTNVARLGGGIGIESRLGAGTTFTLRLPLTLAIIPTLLVTAGGERYAIPQKDLEELVFVDPAQSQVRVERTPEGEVIRLRGRLLPLVRLSQMLEAGDALSKPQDVADDPALPLLCAVVRAGSRRYGLVVDSILTSEEIVVKPLHTSLRRLTTYSGATVLGDGRVALILSTEGIALVSRRRFHGEAETESSQAADEAVERQVVLLVRQTDGEPLAIPLALVRRIVMATSDEIENLSGGHYLTIDGVPTRLIAPREKLELPTGTAPAFVVLPRNTASSLGLLVREIVGTQEIALEDMRALPGDLLALGAAVIDGRITPVADLSRWIRHAGVPLAAPPDRAVAAGSRILVVDDTQFFRDVVARYLTEHGYRVSTAEQGEDALALLAREEFDLVVSDLEMPVMDGWTLSTAIRQLPRTSELPLLALSTLAGDEAVAKSMAHGFDAHEVKLDRDSLLQVIRRLLAARPRRSQAKEVSDA